MGLKPRAELLLYSPTDSFPTKVPKASSAAAKALSVALSASASEAGRDRRNPIRVQFRPILLPRDQLLWSLLRIPFRIRPLPLLLSDDAVPTAHCTMKYSICRKTRLLEEAQRHDNEVRASRPHNRENVISAAVRLPKANQTHRCSLCDTAQN